MTGGFLDGITLELEKALLRELVVIEIVVGKHRRVEMEKGVHETLLLVALFEYIGRETAFLGSQVKNLFVEILAAEFLAELL